MNRLLITSAKVKSQGITENISRSILTESVPFVLTNRLRYHTYPKIAKHLIRYDETHFHKLVKVTAPVCNLSLVCNALITSLKNKKMNDPRVKVK